MDAPLVALTQQCNGDLRQLLFAVFSFLHRRTDFYFVPHPEDLEEGKATMGFKEGDAEKLLLAAFRQFPLRRIPKGGPPAMAAAAKKKKGDGVAVASKASSSSAKSSATSDATNDTKATKITEAISSAVSLKPDDSSGAKAVEEGDVAASLSTLEGNMKGVHYNEEGLQVPVGNGGSMPRYKWTQTLDETTVLIGVPGTLRAKDLDVKITPSKLVVKTKKPLSQGESPHVFAEGELSGKVRPDESTWTVEGGVMIITLDKLQKKYWSNVLVGDEKIDTEQVDSRRHISDYDEITQAQIRKTIFDQTQYHKGLPTSDELLGADDGKPKSSKGRIPELPPGVEFIDQKTLDEAERQKKT